MSEKTAVIIKPTKQQVEWADCELGVLIHYDIHVFEPDYTFRKKWGYQPDSSVFNPKMLDTDQWVRVAKSAGAKYAILVVKHCSGFTLWPSQDYDYSVAQSGYKNGKGDIVKDFVESCKKFGLKPGFYYSTVCNARKMFDQPGKRPLKEGTPEFNAYCDLVEQQLIELWSNYGDLFEIWFDGGQIKGGPDTASLLKKYQPNAVCFQGPKVWHSNLRWVGNEAGHAPYPCWSTIQDVSHYDGTKEIGDRHKGDPKGFTWMPAETDTPNRLMEWFWYENQDYLVKSADELVEAYYKSVGRNTNLLLGMVIDDRGLVPDKDKKVFRQLGREIDSRFSKPIAETSGSEYELEIKFDTETQVNQVIIQENIIQGEFVRKYSLLGFWDGNWFNLSKGTCVGHKRIDAFKPVKISAIKLVIDECLICPNIKRFAVFNSPGMPKRNKFKKFASIVKLGISKIKK